MITHIKEYKDLVGILLGPVRQRPGMFLEQAKISKIHNFITGYRVCLDVTKEAGTYTDSYFDNPGFISWYFDKYNITSSTIERPFLEEANGDEEKALELFFKYLEEYSKFLEAKRENKNQ